MWAGKLWKKKREKSGSHEDMEMASLFSLFSVQSGIQESRGSYLSLQRKWETTDNEYESIHMKRERERERGMASEISLGPCFRKQNSHSLIYTPNTTTICCY